MIHPMDIGILGWHDGTAGQIDSWYSDKKEYDVRFFISHNESPLHAKKTSRPVDTFSYPIKGAFKNRRLIIEEEWWLSLKALGIEAVMLAIDNGFDRLVQFENAKRNGITVLNAIHKSVSLAEEVTLGEGICLYPGVSVGYKAQIDDAVVINTGSQIDHHTRVHAASTIDPGCILAGNVEVGMYSQIHTRSTIINKIKIAQNTELAAGTLMLDHTKPNSLYYGMPGRFMREIPSPH